MEIKLNNLNTSVTILTETLRIIKIFQNKLLVGQKEYIINEVQDFTPKFEKFMMKEHRYIEAVSTKDIIDNLIIFSIIQHAQRENFNIKTNMEVAYRGNELKWMKSFTNGLSFYHEDSIRLIEDYMQRYDVKEFSCKHSLNKTYSLHMNFRYPEDTGENRYRPMCQYYDNERIRTHAQRHRRKLIDEKTISSIQETIDHVIPVKFIKESDCILSWIYLANTNNYEIISEIDHQEKNMIEQGIENAFMNWKKRMSMNR